MGENSYSLKLANCEAHSISFNLTLSQTLISMRLKNYYTPNFTGKKI